MSKGGRPRKLLLTQRSVKPSPHQAFKIADVIYKATQDQVCVKSYISFTSNAQMKRAVSRAPFISRGQHPVNPTKPPESDKQDVASTYETQTAIHTTQDHNPQVQ